MEKRASVIVRDTTTKKPITYIGETAGICWNSPTDDPNKNYERGWDCIVSNHGRTLEYVNIELVLDGYSARAIREFYTHIGGAPSRLQESTRYVKWTGGLWDNMNLLESFDWFKDQTVDNRDAWNMFELSFTGLVHQMEEAGVPKEDIAMLYPLGMKTKIVVKGNLRWFLAMCEQRLCARAYKEYRGLMWDIINALKQYSTEWDTILTNFAKPKCAVRGFCTEKKSCGAFPKFNKEMQDKIIQQIAEMHRKETEDMEEKWRS